MKIDKFTLNGEVLTIHGEVMADDGEPGRWQTKYRVELNETRWMNHDHLLEMLGKLYRDIEDAMYIYTQIDRHEVIRQFEKDWRDTDDPAQDSDGVRADAE